MYAIRFFVGLFEACAFPGYITMLGSWYGPKELTKRLAILLQIESIASMFSGYLQGGLHRSMNGRHGLAGWRWLFIMDAVISFPIAIWGFFGLPDRPHNTKAFYFTPEVRINSSMEIRITNKLQSISNMVSRESKSLATLSKSS
jgi:ACS family pantothenate transporter-like MFS transporter